MPVLFSLARCVIEKDIGLGLEFGIQWLIKNEMEPCLHIGKQVKFHEAFLDERVACFLAYFLGLLPCFCLHSRLRELEQSLNVRLDIQEEPFFFVEN